MKTTTKANKFNEIAFHTRKNHKICINKHTLLYLCYLLKIIPIYELFSFSLRVFDFQLFQEDQFRFYFEEKKIVFFLFTRLRLTDIDTTT